MHRRVKHFTYDQVQPTSSDVNKSELRREMRRGAGRYLATCLTTYAGIAATPEDPRNRYNGLLLDGSYPNADALESALDGYAADTFTALADMATYRGNAEVLRHRVKHDLDRSVAATETLRSSGLVVVAFDIDPTYHTLARGDHPVSQAREEFDPTAVSESYR